MKPHIKRPTAEDISAVLSPSTLTEPVELHKPTFDYLLRCFGNRTSVSSYVSNRITSELVRLSKMKDGTGAKPHKKPASARLKESNRTNAKSRWADVERPDCQKVRVFDKAHKVYLALSPNKFDRTWTAGEIVRVGCEDIDCAALHEYCYENQGKPPKFINIPRYAVDAAKVIACAENESFMKIISFLLARHG